MSENPKSRSSLCGNCKHFVVGGLCELVQGQIKAKDTCDLHQYGNPKPIDTEVNPTHNKLEVNYKPGFMVETVNTTGELIQQAIQMEHDLLSRGISENEVHRAVIEYFSQLEPPLAIPWPGEITGVDLAGRINYDIVPDSGTPLTSFDGLPKNREPYPTSNKSPYGIGTTSLPYPTMPTPDPNSIGGQSNVYDIINPPYPYESAVWDGLASDVNSESSIHGQHGFNVAKAIPEWRYDVEQSQMYPLKIPDIIIPPSGALLEAKEKKKNYRNILVKWALVLGGMAGIDAILKNYAESGKDGKAPTKPLEIFAEYQYHGHDSDDSCAPTNRKVFNLLETHNRPVVPSENLGYTTRHPNCKCTWKILPNYSKSPNSLGRQEESEIHKIENHISNAAKKGTLHTINKEGKLSDKTTRKNPMKESCACNTLMPEIKLNLPKRPLSKKILQEAIANLRSEFNWLTDDYVSKARELATDSGGILYLIRAAGETITDHREGEGEPYRRKLSADELNSMTRTAIGKSMDINHQPELEVDATVLDAEFDKNRKEIQMLVIVRDPQINDAIADRKITAVSINGGMPRSESIEPCDHDCMSEKCELCVVPKGVVLGELDGIAMTFVVTDPNGLYWNGRFVPSAEPGIKFTKIDAL